MDDTTERYTVRCDCGGNMPGPARSDRPVVPDPRHLPAFGGREMEQEGLMDYTDSGFRAGFDVDCVSHGMRCASARSGLNRGRLRPCRPCASIWKRTAAPV